MPCSMAGCLRSNVTEGQATQTVSQIHNTNNELTEGITPWKHVADQLSRVADAPQSSTSQVDHPAPYLEMVATSNDYASSGKSPPHGQRSSVHTFGDKSSNRMGNGLSVVAGSGMSPHASAPSRGLLITAEDTLPTLAGYYGDYPLLISPYGGAKDIVMTQGYSTESHVVTYRMRDVGRQPLLTSVVNHDVTTG